MNRSRWSFVLAGLLVVSTGGVALAQGRGGGDADAQGGDRRILEEEANRLRSDVQNVDKQIEAARTELQELRQQRARLRDEKDAATTDAERRRIDGEIKSTTRRIDEYNRQVNDLFKQKDSISQRIIQIGQNIPGGGGNRGGNSGGGNDGRPSFWEKLGDVALQVGSSVAETALTRWIEGDEDGAEDAEQLANLVEARNTALKDAQNSPNTDFGDPILDSEGNIIGWDRNADDEPDFTEGEGGDADNPFPGGTVDEDQGKVDGGGSSNPEGIYEDGVLTGIDTNGDGKPDINVPRQPSGEKGQLGDFHPPSAPRAGRGNNSGGGGKKKDDKKGGKKPSTGGKKPSTGGKKDDKKDDGKKDDGKKDDGKKDDGKSDRPSTGGSSRTTTTASSPRTQDRFGNVAAGTGRDGRGGRSRSRPTNIKGRLLIVPKPVLPVQGGFRRNPGPQAGRPQQGFGSNPNARPPAGRAPQGPGTSQPARQPQPRQPAGGNWEQPGPDRWNDAKDNGDRADNDPNWGWNQGQGWGQQGAQPNNNGGWGQPTNKQAGWGQQGGQQNSGWGQQGGQPNNGWGQPNNGGGQPGWGQPNNGRGGQQPGGWGQPNNGRGGQQPGGWGQPNRGPNNGFNQPGMNDPALAGLPPALQELLLGIQSVKLGITKWQEEERKKRNSSLSTTSGGAGDPYGYTDADLRRLRSANGGKSTNSRSRTRTRSRDPLLRYRDPRTGRLDLNKVDLWLVADDEYGEASWRKPLDPRRTVKPILIKLQMLPSALRRGFNPLQGGYVTLKASARPIEGFPIDMIRNQGLKDLQRAEVHYWLTSSSVPPVRSRSSRGYDRY